MLFDFKITEEGSINTIFFNGELIERSQASELINSVAKSVEEGRLKFIFDLTELRYMNSSGLNVLINLLTKIRNNSGEVVICNVNKKIRELLIITKLSTMFNIVDSGKQAVEQLSAE